MGMGRREAKPRAEVSNVRSPRSEAPERRQHRRQRSVEAPSLQRRARRPAADRMRPHLALECFGSSADAGSRRTLEWVRRICLTWRRHSRAMRSCRRPVASYSQIGQS